MRSPPQAPSLDGWTERQIPLRLTKCADLEVCHACCSWIVWGLEVRHPPTWLIAMNHPIHIDSSLNQCECSTVMTKYQIMDRSCRISRAVPRRTYRDRAPRVSMPRRPFGGGGSGALPPSSVLLIAAVIHSPPAAAAAAADSLQACQAAADAFCNTVASGDGVNPCAHFQPSSCSNDSFIARLARGSPAKNQLPLQWRCTQALSRPTHQTQTMPRLAIAPSTNSCYRSSPNACSGRHPQPSLLQL